jgi:hypothetical protein
MSQHLGFRPTFLATSINVCTWERVKRSIRSSPAAPKLLSLLDVRSPARDKRFTFGPSSAFARLTRAPPALRLRLTVFLVVRRLRAVRVLGLMAPPIELWMGSNRSEMWPAGAAT